MNYWFVQIFLVWISCIKMGITKHEKRIIGGENSLQDHNKWTASIKGDITMVKKSVVYAASIIKSEGGIRWLVTAAHCFYPSNGVKFIDMTNPILWHVAISKFESVYEKHGLKDKAMEKLKILTKNKLVTNDFHIKKIIVHPDYKPIQKTENDKPVSMDNDIALIKLTDTLPADQPSLINALELPNFSVNTVWPEIDKECIVAGWECQKNSKIDNYIAKKVTVKILNNEKCEKLTSKLFNMNLKTDFCAIHTTNNNGFCLEDMGSGLVCDNNGKPTLAGVFSRGYNDQPIQFPPVFTRVSSYTNWIKEVIKNN